MSTDFDILRPVVVIDTREQEALVFGDLEAVRGTLTTGDYSFRGGEHLFAVERKSVADLVGCCCGKSRERFGRELHRLRGFRFKRLVIVGRCEDVAAGHYRGAVNPKSVLNTVAAFEVRYDCPVVWCATAELAGRTVERWVWFYAREVVKACDALRRGAGAGAAQRS